MPFDSNLPAANSAISSAELRSQFNGLNDLLSQSINDASADAANALGNAVGDMQAAIDNASNFMQGQLDDAIQSQTAALPASVSALGLTVSDPPTQEEVQNIANKLDELLQVLKRA